MAKRPKTRERKARVTTRASKPKSQALPGMEDHAIKPLEDVASRYAEIRDQRMELTEEEHTLKVHALKLMKKYDKTIYRHNGVEITIVPGEDDVKVRVRKPSDDQDDDDTDAAADSAEIRQTEERRQAVDAD